MHENTKVASGVAGAMVTIEPRRIPAPARAPSPPSATIVPASMRRPAASPTRPATAIRPRRSPAPACAPASPWTTISPPRMPGPLARIDAAELAPRRAPNHEPPAAHPRPGPVAGVALDVQLAAAHAGPGVHPDVARDGEPARRSSPAPTNFTRLRSPSTRTSSPLPGDGEELAHARALLAVPHRERLDLRAARGGQAIGRQRLGLERHGRLLAQGEGEGHGTSSRRWMWCGPRLPP